VLTGSPSRTSSADDDAGGAPRPILFALAVGGTLAGKRISLPGLGTMRTDNPTFVVLLIGVIILLGALTFFPALLLGPIVQGVTGHLY
jgi:K+-transporting ATPase ATPase A chain